MIRILLATLFLLSSSLAFAKPTEDLVQAAIVGDPSAASDALIRGADVNGIVSLSSKAGGFSDLGCNGSFRTAPLIVASEFQHTNIVELLLKSGANPNLKVEPQGLCSSPHTPLIRAARNGNLQIERLLLQAGVPANHHLNYYAVRAAIEMNNLNFLELLIDSGFDGSSPGSPFRTLGHHSSEVTPLFEAAYYNNLEAVKLLIRKGFSSDVSSFKSKLSPLMAASYIGSIDIITELLRAGADINGFYGWHDESTGAVGRMGTALYYAVTKNNLSVATYLIGQGAQVSPIDSNDDASTNLLLYAIRNSSVAMAQLLLSHGSEANRRFQGESHWLPLVAALGPPTTGPGLPRNIDIFKLLISKGADVNDYYRSSTKQTILMLAVMNCDLEAVQILTAQGDIDKYKQDLYGSTARDYAVGNAKLNLGESCPAAAPYLQ